MPRVRSNIVEEIVEHIVKKVNNLDYGADGIVSEVSLSQELNVSRTPVREAIHKLIEYGILERTPTKVVVKPLKIEDISEIIQVREAIETMSAKIIVQNGGLNSEQIKMLEYTNKAIERSISGSAHETNFSHDHIFHDLIIGYSKNSRFIEIRKKMSIQSQRPRKITVITPQRYSETIQEHKAIIKGFINNDYDEIREAISTHLSGSLENYKKILSGKQWTSLMNEIKEKS